MKKANIHRIFAVNKPIFRRRGAEKVVSRRQARGLQEVEGVGVEGGGEAAAGFADFVE